MTVVSTSAAEVIEAKPVSAGRNLALDRARTVLILLVLLHHAVMPYTYYGHTDIQTLLAFDGIVVFNDSYFMAAMFLLSGLFVWPSLTRKGIGHFLRDRLLRLGLPFAVCAIILMPLAYYAIDLREHGSSFGAFWWKTVTTGPWPSGPAWFVGVLLLFDVAAAIAYRVMPRAIEVLGQLSSASLERPFYAFWMFLAASIVAYIPIELYFGPGRWFTFGPLAIQVGRILLYLLYFFVGIGIGTTKFDLGLLSRSGGLMRHWLVWLTLSLLSYGCIVALLYVKHNDVADMSHLPLWWRLCHTFTFVFFSAAQTFCLLAVFLRFDAGGWSILDPLRASAFGIYLIHYVPMLWLQYALFGASLAPAEQETAVLKVLIAFVLTLAISWAATAALRRIPGATRVL
jgi:surface polysaccharide O-acyltransferase-like enzyme